MWEWKWALLGAALLGAAAFAALVFLGTCEDPWEFLGALLVFVSFSIISYGLLRLAMRL